MEHCLNFPQTHFRVKGSTENLIPELERFVDYELMLDENQIESYAVLVNRLEEVLGKTDFKISTVEALKLKRRDSSPGEPWVSRFSTFGSILEHLMDGYGMSEEEAYEELAQFVDDVENDIIEGKETQDTLQFSYYVHSKEDKYAPKKILSNTYRSIQGGDWVPQVIAMKYTANWSILYKEFVPEVVVKVGPEWDRRMRRFWNKHTYATDITAFDRCVSVGMIRGFVDYLGRVTSMPPAVTRLMFDMISRGSLILPDGRRMTRSGGNPSGMHWTTEMNCFVHHWMSIDVYSLSLGCSPYDISQRVVLALCGDDELVGGSEEDMYKLGRSVSMFSERWGFQVKQEMYIGEDGEETSVFPPHFHAPFLDCTSVKVGLRVIPLPVRPHRRMASLFYGTEKGVPYKEIVSGVFESVLAWIVRSDQGEDVPPCVDEFVELARVEKVGRSMVSILAGYGIDIGYGAIRV